MIHISMFSIGSRKICCRYATTTEERHGHRLPRPILAQARRGSSKTSKEPSSSHSQTANDRSATGLGLTTSTAELKQTKDFRTWMMAHHASFSPEDAENVYRSCLSPNSPCADPSVRAKMQDEARIMGNLSILKR